MLGFVSAKGAPGVTVTAFAVAASVESDDAVFCELDPAGGDLECWTGRTGEADLITLVSAMRHESNPAALLADARSGRVGVMSVLAPCSAAEAGATIAAAGDSLASLFASLPEVVCVDAGRWSPDQPTAERLAGCDVVAVVCRPTVAGVQHARGLIGVLRDRFAMPVVVVLVGSRPYGADEVRAVVDVSVAGTIAWDPRGAGALLRGELRRGWRRSALARSARTVFASLTASTATTVAEPSRIGTAGA